jgi:hypothetical protein
LHDHWYFDEAGHQGAEKANSEALTLMIQGKKRRLGEGLK